MAKLENTTLESIIPESLLAFKEVVDICKALNLSIADVTGNIYHDAIIANFDIMSEEVIDLLGWQWHADYYDSSASLDTKRALVKQSLDWHRHKGTQYAVDSILKTIAPKYHSESWQEYGGKPYYFRIVETDADKVDYSDKEMIAAVNSVKNVRSWLDSIVVDTAQNESNDYIGYVSGKHSLDATINVLAEQGYWLDSGYISQYWKGYHVPEGDGHQLNRKWQLDESTQLDGAFAKHLHEWLGSTRFDGKEWLDSRGNNQKHDVELSSVVAASLSGRNMGCQLDGSLQLNSTWRLEWPKHLLYRHGATVTTVKGDTRTTEAI